MSSSKALIEFKDGRKDGLEMFPYAVDSFGVKRTGQVTERDRGENVGLCF